MFWLTASIVLMALSSAHSIPAVKRNTNCSRECPEHATRNAEDCKCRCNQGYMMIDGDCYKNPCTSSPCVRGTCRPSYNYNDEGYTCKCPPGVTGRTCDIELITCKPPRAIMDGVMTAQSKPSYNVGDLVKYRCNSTYSEVDMTCLANGEWSDVKNTACYECSYGWFWAYGRCFKYFNDSVKYPETEVTCRQNGATVATAHEPNLNEYLKGRVDNKGDEYWLGVVKSKDSNKFIWSDGKPLKWTSWKDGNKDMMNRDDCIWAKASDGDWRDDRCNKKFKFFCQRKASDSMSCLVGEINCDKRPDGRKPNARDSDVAPIYEVVCCLEGWMITDLKTCTCPGANYTNGDPISRLAKFDWSPSPPSV